MYIERKNKIYSNRLLREAIILNMLNHGQDARLSELNLLGEEISNRQFRRYLKDLKDIGVVPQKTKIKANPNTGDPYIHTDMVGSAYVSEETLQEAELGSNEAQKLVRLARVAQMLYHSHMSSDELKEYALNEMYPPCKNIKTFNRDFEIVVGAKIYDDDEIDKDCHIPISEMTDIYNDSIQYEDYYCYAE